MKKKCLMTLAIATVTAITAQLSQIQATTVTESVATPVPTIQPTISCTSTHFEYMFIPSYCIHDVDANRDCEFTIFDLIRVKESIVNNPENVYNAQDLLHLQYVLLNVQKPYLCGAPLPAVTPTAEPKEE